MTRTAFLNTVEPRFAVDKLPGSAWFDRGCAEPVCVSVCPVLPRIFCWWRKTGDSNSVGPCDPPP